MATIATQLENRTKSNQHRPVTTSDLVKGLQIGLAATYAGKFVYPTSFTGRAQYRVDDDILAELTASGAFHQYADGETHAFQSKGVVILATLKLTGGR